jgi:hypothetical protein
MHTQLEAPKSSRDTLATTDHIQLPKMNIPKANGAFSTTDIAHKVGKNTVHKKERGSNQTDHNNREGYVDGNIQTAAQKHRAEAKEHLHCDLLQHAATESVYNILQK